MDALIIPICLFTYKRLHETQHTVKALQQNYLAVESDLYIFSDGPKNEIDKKNVDEIRKFIHNISGFRSITIIEAVENKGLANSIIDGVSLVMKKHGRAIVLEDDLITTPNFLNFMVQSLDFYANNSKIFSISGHSFALSSLEQYPKDYYLSYRASSWGWASWADRWQNIDWEVKDYDSFKRSFSKQIKFMRGGSDMPGMLRNQMKGKIDSWAIRWCYSQFKNDLLTIYPSKSKLLNIGFGAEATHNKRIKNFVTELDIGSQIDFIFDSYPEMNLKLAKEYRRNFSVINRLRNKLRL